ncbi:hypothetical protein PAP_06920 [Palaeococcus pacificus DY20341]|uniref:5'-deoxynucleotidase n=1 Tax=Palaeococcus pacificus DY20341 TaxID=1343739 RepID=A0A075LYY4_9EURY|nr:HD family hydrolase [Palaeococcus pacificus]AIF69778.1 hypothetical protein PAP_06920 [Palaeococcus pacificus DY20341]
MLDVFSAAGDLKKIPRMGWLLRGVSNPESVADHSYRVVLITLILADELREKGIQIDVERALKIAILHDLGESRITDIPLSAQRYLDKKKAEKKAMVELLLGLGKRGLDYYKLFEEYEEESSLEGRLVKFADKLEMVLQAYEYEKAGYKNLEEFWSVVDYLKRSEFYEYFKPFFDEFEKIKKG